MAAEREAIGPRFANLAAGDVHEKTPGEVVTVADRECEALLTRALREVEDVPVVGEEAAAEDPTLLDLITTEPAVWLVDPLDGTSNFAAASPHYAVMVALVRDGVTVASWMWQPQAQLMATSLLGSGAFLNERPVRAAGPARDPHHAVGVIKDRFMNDTMTDHVGRTFPDSQRVPGTNCAGWEYPDLVAGQLDHIVYWRTLPWDHAPGVLFATEAGLQATRPDGTAYQPGQRSSGLLVTHPTLAQPLAELLWGEP